MPLAHGLQRYLDALLLAWTRHGRCSLLFFAIVTNSPKVDCTRHRKRPSSHQRACEHDVCHPAQRSRFEPAAYSLDVLRVRAL
jgi:hypothetical protein